MKFSILVCTLLFGLSAGVSKAGDTLSVSLPQAEAQFVARNLNLIANKFSINESQAYAVQARLLPNPTIYVEQMPYNQQSKEAFPLKQSNSEQVVQVQQLLLLAGKRNKQLAIAQTRTDIAADRFYDLIRTLKYQLRSTFYDLYYAQQTLPVYGQGIETLQRTVGLYQQQYDKGNVPLKDLTRLKAYLFSLTIERQQLLRRITDDQASLTVLLNTDATTQIRPVVNINDLNRYRPDSLNPAELINMASQNRYDLKGFVDQQKQEEQNVALQKALAIPDLTLQATYDRNGSYIPNYVGVGVGIGLPVFNKNQGNIQAAKIRVQGSQVAVAAYRQQVDTDVQRALVKARQADQVYRSFDRGFTDSFGKLIQGVTLNYQKRNIDVVEFLDFFDSYKAVQLQYNQLQNDRTQSVEELNFAVGTSLFEK